jgi:hypothetical protein
MVRFFCALTPSIGVGIPTPRGTPSHLNRYPSLPQTWDDGALTCGNGALTSDNTPLEVERRSFKLGRRRFEVRRRTFRLE